MYLFKYAQRAFFSFCFFFISILFCLGFFAYEGSGICFADSVVIYDELGRPLDPNAVYYIHNPKAKKPAPKVDRYDEFGETPLVKALRDRNKISDIKKLLASGANPNILDSMGFSPLNVATHEGNIEAIKLLLKHGAIVRPDVIDLAEGFAANDKKEYLALFKGYKVIPLPPPPPPSPKDIPKNERSLSLSFYSDAIELKKIIEEEEKTKKINPSVTLAAMRGLSEEIIKDLINNQNSNINEINPAFGTPLGQAIEQGHDASYIASLLNLGADPNLRSSVNGWPLEAAVANNRPELVRLLLDSGANLEIKNGHLGTNPFKFAVTKGYSEIIKIFLEKGANPDYGVKGNIEKNDTPLIIAAVKLGSPSPEIVRTLIASGANPKIRDHNDCNPLSLLRWDEKTLPVALILLDAGVSPNEPCFQKEHNGTLYNWAIVAKSLELLKAAKKAKVDPNERDWNGASPLLLTIVQGVPEFTRAMIEVGASAKRSFSSDEQRKNNAKDNILRQAILRGDLETLRILLDAGVKINENINIPEKSAALHLAVDENRPEMLSALLKAGAKIEATDGYQRTPLHYAALGRRVEAIKVLVAAGANVKAKDKAGRIPMDYVEGKPNSDELKAALLGAK
jgi:ankyrin repeat protein